MDEIGGIEGVNQPEKEMIYKFYEIALDGDEALWCVDGRFDPKEKKGPQMLGGVLHPLLLLAIYKNEDFDETFVNKGLDSLERMGIKIGAHRGEHKDAEKGVCDCGFCDQMRKILKKAQDNETEITKRLMSVYEQNKVKFGDEEVPFGDIIKKGFDKLNAYNAERIKITGEDLLSTVENKEGATVEDLKGDHQEVAAFVNLKEKTTYDTKTATVDGKQAFNLDLWAVEEIADKLGIKDKNFVDSVSLILYMATEMVLVEDKGKTALGVQVHS